LNRRELPLYFAVFLDLVGFGMPFMDLQLRAEEFGAAGWMIGAILASYNVVQLFVSPFWGSLSDRVGRKPILLICTALSAGSMLVYALFPSLLGILLSRIFAGMAAANVVVGQAYLADITAEEHRKRAMGRVSASIMLGLIAGPALGGYVASQYGSSALGFAAAGASALSFLWILIGVKPIKPSQPSRISGNTLVFNVRAIAGLPGLGRLLAIAAAGWFVLACLEGTFARLVQATQQLSKAGAVQLASNLFSLESLVGAGAGLLLAWLAVRLSSGALLRLGYLLQAFGVALFPLAPDVPALVVGSVLFALGAGIVSPTINALASELTPENQQGLLFGMLQSTRSVGFIIGPILGGAMFDMAPGLPYYLAAGVGLIAALAVWLPAKTPQRTSGNAEHGVQA
jgi:MFS family permease